mgnify:CR=1 FL=1
MAMGNDPYVVSNLMNVPRMDTAGDDMVATLGYLANLREQEKKKSTIEQSNEQMYALSPELMIKYGKFLYRNFEECWTGINTIAQNVVAGFSVSIENRKYGYVPKGATPEMLEANLQKVLDWHDKVELTEEKLMVQVRNALIEGCGLAEVTTEVYENRDKEGFTFQMDEKNKVKTISQDGNPLPEIPVEAMRYLVLHKLFDGDIHGISALYPMFQTATDLIGVREVNRVLNDIYRAPTWWIEAPEGSDPAQQQNVALALKNRPPDMDIFLPAGYKINQIGNGLNQFHPDELMKNIMDRMFVGLGFPKPLVVPEGYNNQSRQMMDFIIYNRVKPYQIILANYLKKVYKDILGVEGIRIDFREVSIFDSQQKANLCSTIQNNISSMDNLIGNTRDGQQKNTLIKARGQLIEQLSNLVTDGVL